jgi:hypothetical protein
VTLRFRTRFVHATLVDAVRGALTDLGWILEPINFGGNPVTIVDYQPDERGERVNPNTVAVTLGDAPPDDDEELGAAVGGLRSVVYPVYIDAYMAEQPISVAICDDIVMHFTDLAMGVEDKINGGTVPGVTLVIEDVAGPRRPPASVNADNFKRYWRVVELSAVLYFNT